MTASSNSPPKAKSRRHRIHANPFTVRGPIEVPDWRAVYGREAPMALDIGFGKGAFLLELARRHPEWNVLGLEIRDHLVADVLDAGHAAGLTNLHAMLANANSHLGELVPNGSVAFVSINFPDPWYKKRHHKRRVVQPAWLAVLLTKLAMGAELHAMTDYAPIAEQMRDVLGACPALHVPHGTARFASESTTGITTERELTHLRRGDPVYRLHYVYRGPAGAVATEPQTIVPNAPDR